MVKSEEKRFGSLRSVDGIQKKAHIEVDETRIFQQKIVLNDIQRINKVFAGFYICIKYLKIWI